VTVRKIAIIVGFGAAVLCQLPTASNAQISCPPDEVALRAIPPETRWEKPVPEHEPGNALRSWMRLALGFDYRIIGSAEFSYIEYPTPPGYLAAFFITRTDQGWCGSGGCALTLYVCKERGCTAVLNEFNGEIAFPGTSSAGWKDFAIDGADLYSFDRGELRRVCKVEFDD
jgi:hypothetical protein